MKVCCTQLPDYPAVLPASFRLAARVTSCLNDQVSGARSVHPAGSQLAIYAGISGSIAGRIEGRRSTHLTQLALCSALILLVFLLTAM